MPTNKNRRNLLRRIRETGYPGSITEVFQASDQGIDLVSQFQAEQEQQQKQMQVAQTQQQQETGLREEHARGNTQASMAFPDVQPNQSFNTVGMKAPIDIQKIDDQGHLVESYKNVPPGIQDLPTGPNRGTIIESPPSYQKGGFEKQFNTNYQESQNYQRIKGSRKGVRQNPDGSHSTHLMADNNKDEAWPTLFQSKDGSWFEPTDAYKEAKKRGEIYKFDSKEELIRFARKGDWKNTYQKGGFDPKGDDTIIYPPGDDQYQLNPLNKEILDIRKKLDDPNINNEDLQKAWKWERNRINTQSNKNPNRDMVAQNGGFDSKSTLLPEVSVIGDTRTSKHIDQKALYDINRTLDTYTRLVESLKESYPERVTDIQNAEDKITELNKNRVTYTDKSYIRKDINERKPPTYIYNKDVSFNKRGAGLTEEEFDLRHDYDWYDQNKDKRNFGYTSKKQFLADYPDAVSYSKKGETTWYLEGETGAGHPVEFTESPKYKPIPKLPIKQVELLPTTPEESVLSKAVDIPEMETLKDKVKDVSFNYHKYAGADDAGVMDKHGRYFTLTLKDGSTRRLSPKTYRNYFGTESLLTPGKKLKVFKKEGGFAKYQKGGYIQKYPHGGSHDYIPAEASSTSVYMPPNNLQIAEPDPEVPSTLYQSPPEKSILSKAINVAANPLSAFGRSVRGEDVNPGYIQRGENPIDVFALGLVNPAAWAESGQYAYKHAAKGDYLGAGLNALGMVPAIPAIKALKGVHMPSILHKGKGVYKGRSYIPTSKEGEKINKIIEQRKKYIRSDEYINKRSANTGESKAQIKAEVEDYIRNSKTSDFDFKPASKMRDAQGKYYHPQSVIENPGGKIAVRNPYTGVDDVLSGKRPSLKSSDYDAIDHEWGHFFSPTGKFDKANPLYKKALNYERAVGDAQKAAGRSVKPTWPEGVFLPRQVETGIYKNYPKLELYGSTKHGKQINANLYQYLNNPAEQQVRIVRMNDFFKKHYGWDGQSHTLTDNMLDKFISNVQARGSTVGSGKFRLKVPGDVAQLIKNTKDYGNSINNFDALKEQLRNIMPKAWALSAPVGIGVLSQTDTKQKGGRRLYKTGGPKISSIESAPAPVSPPVPVPITVSPAELFQYLTEVKGLSKNHALGMINNIGHESGFEFGAHNPDDLGKPSSGLFQHRGSRRDSLVEFAGGGDEWSKDWRTQIDYMMTENDTKKYLKRTFNTPDEASSWFTEFWERPDKAKQKAEDRLITLPNIIDSVSKPIVYPNLLEEVTITPETQSEQYEQETTKNIQNLVNTYPPESYASKFSTQVNMPPPLITQQRKGGYKTGGINEFATSYPKKKEIINTSSLGAIQEFGGNISTIFKPKTYKKGRLTLRGKLNEPQIDLGWNPNLRTTPFGGPTLSKPSYSGNISANLRLRKNLSLYGNVDYLSGAQPEYKAGLRFRFKRGGYKSKFCW